MRNFLSATALATVLALSGGVAHATPFAASVTFTDTDSNTYNDGLNVTATSGSFNQTLTVGQSHTFQNFMTFTTSDSDHDEASTDTVTLTFNWSKPVSSITNVTGNATEDVDSSWFFGWYDSATGKITWQNPIAPVLFNDGASLQISLTNVTLTPTSNYHDDDRTLIGTVDLTIKDLADPASVPEPMSVALLGMGLLGLGTIRQVRRVRDTTING